MNLHLAYTWNDADLQVQIGAPRPQQAVTGSRFQAPTRLDPFLGCPLVDDWVALKQQIKEANDIVEVVGGYIPLKPAGPTFKGLCPFHDDSRPSFDVDPRRQRYRCWACNKYGDVISFVQEHERVSFQEALELLAKKAGISVEKFEKSSSGPSRASMLEAMRWAAEQFQTCLLDSPNADKARIYLGERKLTGETVRRFRLGFAPGLGDWLVQRAGQAKIPFDVLETVGLVAKRNEGRGGYYDRFRDRVMFPIRDLRGQVVGFGGRVLPSSPLAERGPKYYNSSETPLFSKSNQLYGIDQARDAATKAGYLTVVEGYTDVLMAHQHGIANVVSTMGTALNQSHVRKLRGFVPRVVLIFDADAGGDTGVERALEVFVSQELDLRVGTLPDGLDPCDLLVQQGPAPFVKAVERSVDVFDFKLLQVWQREASNGMDGQRRAADEMLKTLASMPDQKSVKLELMVNRIGHRLQIKEETVWTRLAELRAARRPEPARNGSAQQAQEPAPRRSGKAPPHEVQLMELVLAEPALLEKVRENISITELEHPGLRQTLEALYLLLAEGRPADLDHLRPVLDNERLLEHLFLLQDRGLLMQDRPAALAMVLDRFHDRKDARRKFELKNQVLAADDFSQQLEILRQIQKPK